MTVVSPFAHRPEIILGVTHLIRADGKPDRLLKCLFCDFRNVREDEITHHIRWTKDYTHDVDPEDLDKSRYILTVELKHKHSPYNPDLAKAALKLPWIPCLFCSYKDKIEFDLSLHMLQEHRKELLQVPLTRRERKAAKELSGEYFARFEGAMEYRLDRAVQMAKRNSKYGEVNN